jgi:uncharacterized phage protein (TIGR02220 family)
MAGDWIKIEENTPDKPEVAEIASYTGLDVDAVMGKLIRVWAWASRNCHGDGVTSVTAMSLIDRAACHDGFSKGMAEAGWLIIEGKELTFPKFDEHNSESAKDRGQAYRRKQRQRARSSAEKLKTTAEDEVENLQKSSNQSRLSHAGNVTSATQVSRSDRDKNGTIESESESESEERLIEDSNSNIMSSSKTNCDDAHNQTNQNEATMKPEQPTNQTYGPQSRAVLHMLNEVAGRNFRETDQNLKIIKMRLKEPGVEVQEVRKMIQRQLDMWRGTEFERFLRPETLFNATKFSGYYDDRDQPIKRGRDAMRAQTEQHGWKDDKF